MLTIEQVATALCPQELIGHYQEEDGSQYICSRSLYPNGDSITAFLKQGLNGSADFSDEGVTVTYLERAGVKMSERRERTIQLILNAHHMERKGAVLVRPGVTRGNGAGLFREFCDAVLRISTFELEHELAEQDLYVPKVDAVLRRAAGTQYELRPRFFDEQHDRDKLYPIDWAVFRGQSRKHVFAIAGHDSILTMPAAVHYFRSVGVAVPTLAVVSPHIKLSKRNMARVAHASQEMLFRDVYENEERIRSWLHAA